MVSGTDSLRFNFQPGTMQQPSIFRGTITCIVTATTPQGRQSDSSSIGFHIWNGCDIGVEPWDNKVLLTGPLCDDYQSGYTPPGCSISNPSACLDALWRRYEGTAPAARPPN